MVFGDDFAANSRTGEFGPRFAGRASVDNSANRVLNTDFGS
jgi:hypothetical protein